MNGFARIWVAVIVAAYGCEIARADADRNPFEEVLECSGRQRAGADVVMVRVPRDGDEAGIPRLVGIRAGQTLWQRKFPNVEQVNTAKFAVAMEGATISLRSEYPFSFTSKIQEYRWDGNQLRKLSTRRENPSLEDIDDAIVAIADGKVHDLEALKLEIMYPQRTISPDVLVKAIARGHAAAARLAANGDNAKAAERLKLMFDLTVFLAQEARSEPISAALPASRRWLIAWQTMELPARDYIAALNDCGFYLQQAGDHRAALQVFREVEQADSARTVNLLNLADSLWALGERPEAAEYYRRYEHMMQAQHHARAIPSRVAARVKAALDRRPPIP